MTLDTSILSQNQDFSNYYDLSIIESLRNSRGRELPEKKRRMIRVVERVIIPCYLLTNETEKVR